MVEESAEVLPRSKADDSGKRWMIWLPTVLSLGLILGAIAVYSYFKSPSSPKSVQTEATKEMVSEEDVTKTTKSEVFVGETKEGKVLPIEKAKFVDPGRIVVYLDKEGRPGELLGESELLQSGETSDFLIQLDKEIKKGQILYLIVFPEDSGESKVFSEPDALEDIDGNVSVFKVIVEGLDEASETTEGSL